MARSLSVSRRFSLAYVALAALLGIAVRTFALLIERPTPKPPPPWSAWAPTKTDRTARQTQIAAHVAGQYRLGDGKKLVDVVVRDPLKSPTIQDVALTRTLYPTKRSDIISAVGTDKVAMYILCGAGGPPNCTITAGRPTEERAEVLRREALELALYTFRYVDDTDSVLISFPRKDVPYVMYFAKGDLSDQLRSTPATDAGAADRLAAAEPLGERAQHHRRADDPSPVPRHVTGRGRRRKRALPCSPLMERDPLLACTIGSSYW